MARILIIDDEPEVRDVLALLLERDGHEVLKAADGGKGIEALNGASVDLVITDIFMPHKEGIETIIEMRALRPALKIIAISGGGPGVPYLEFARQLGADAVLGKPIRADALRDAVRACVGQ